RPDPIVYLDGGPGGQTLRQAKRIFDNFASFAPDRDFVLFDQRGIGYSEPALDCPEHTQFLYDTLDQDDNSIRVVRDYNASIRACHDRLVDQGIDLWAYTTAASAADVNDLRIALGYRTWNLLGASYGTRLGLAVMRSFPQGVRSVVLDSTIPPQLEPGGGASFMRSLDVLFNRCTNDTSCNRSYA